MGWKMADGVTVNGINHPGSIRELFVKLLPSASDLVGSLLRRLGVNLREGLILRVLFEVPTVEALAISASDCLGRNHPAMSNTVGMLEIRIKNLSGLLRVIAPA